MNILKRILAFFSLLIVPLFAQEDSIVVQDGVYNRPFISSTVSSPVAIGGYLEANTNYFSEDGVSEGFTMEMRRFNIFFYSTIIPRIKFLAELEFEHGTEEIALETAQVDFEFNTALVFRAGILLVPIGAFNQNHDSPRWEFVERPLVDTQIIPTTFSGNRSAARRKSATSSRTPRRRTAPPRPSAAARCSIRGRSGPSPTSQRTRPGSSSWTERATRSQQSSLFSALKLPT